MKLLSNIVLGIAGLSLFFGVIYLAVQSI